MIVLFLGKTLHNFENFPFSGKKTWQNLDDFPLSGKKLQNFENFPFSGKKHDKIWMIVLFLEKKHYTILRIFVFWKKTWENLDEFPPSGNMTQLRGISFLWIKHDKIWIIFLNLGAKKLSQKASKPILAIPERNSVLFCVGFPCNDMPLCLHYKG